MKKAVTIAIAVALILIAGLSYGIYYFSMHGASADQLPVADSEQEAALEKLMEESEAPDTENDVWYAAFESSGKSGRSVPLDKYIATCPDIYAWIEIPGTDIDYPIAYCEDASDPFYYTHDADGAPSENGMIITDSLNGRDFSDPLTLIYGKAPDDGTMFAQLSRFRDPAFFADHDTVNIYLTDTVLSYKVYACYIGSAEHMFASYDFNDPVSFGKYFDSIDEVRDLSINIRPEAKPVFSDHVITLITHCDDESKRLFVHAVLDSISR